MGIADGGGTGDEGFLKRARDLTREKGEGRRGKRREDMRRVRRCACLVMTNFFEANANKFYCCINQEKMLAGFLPSTRTP